MEAKKSWRWERRGDNKETFLEKVSLGLSMPVQLGLEGNKPENHAKYRE